jgi:DNA-binding MarR family transcriptional regulator
MSSVSSSDYQALAAIRYRIRRFLTFSETKARRVGVEPQQHQLLLAIRGREDDVSPTIRYVAERLQIQHHSAVELVRRSVANRLVAKRPSPRDRREVFLEITTKGERLLEKLAVVHLTELRSMAPVLVDAIAVVFVAPPRAAPRATK